jgi:DNA-binding transcriptional ArsR family regulator
MLLREPAQLRALADPMRIRILEETVDEPRTVKQLAAILGVPPTRLYYHVKILQQHRMLRVASRRMVGGIQERSYLATARSWNPDPSLTASALDLSGVLRAMTDLLHAELELAARENPSAPIAAPTSPLPILSFTETSLTTDEVADIQRGLEELFAPYVPDARADRPGRRRYRFFLAGYQVASPGEPDAP